MFFHVLFFGVSKRKVLTKRVLHPMSVIILSSKSSMRTLGLTASVVGVSSTEFVTVLYFLSQ